jgi:hypothetical protein
MRGRTAVKGEGKAGWDRAAARAGHCWLVRRPGAVEVPDGQPRCPVGRAEREQAIRWKCLRKVCPVGRARCQLDLRLKPQVGRRPVGRARPQLPSVSRARATYGAVSGHRHAGTMTGEWTAAVASVVGSRGARCAGRGGSRQFGGIASVGSAPSAGHAVSWSFGPSRR